VYKDKLQNCSCNQFHYIGTYKQVETNSMTRNRGGNNGSEKTSLFMIHVTFLYSHLEILKKIFHIFFSYSLRCLFQ